MHVFPNPVTFMYIYVAIAITSYLVHTTQVSSLTLQGMK